MKEWKGIPGFESDYQVSSDGVVKNLNTGRTVAVCRDDYDEPIVWLRASGRRGKRRIAPMMKLFEDQSVSPRPVGG